MTSEILLRLGILLLVGLLAWLIIRLGQRYVNSQRRQALAAPPFQATRSGNINKAAQVKSLSVVRILAFSSADCHQCHQFQTPALQRVQDARGEQVSVVEVDATTAHDLVKTYHVLTVPSTVILDAEDIPHAVNYGFANTQRLLEQVDAVLEKKV